MQRTPAGFPSGMSGDWGGDGWGDTARAAAYPAFHLFWNSTEKAAGVTPAAPLDNCF